MSERKKGFFFFVVKIYGIPYFLIGSMCFHTGFSFRTIKELGFKELNCVFYKLFYTSGVNKVIMRVFGSLSTELIHREDDTALPCNVKSQFCYLYLIYLKMVLSLFDC